VHFYYDLKSVPQNCGKVPQKKMVFAEKFFKEMQYLCGFCDFFRSSAVPQGV